MTPPKTSDIVPTEILHKLQNSSWEETDRLLLDLIRQGSQHLEVILAFAKGEIKAGHTKHWPRLIKYFVGVLDREVDLLVLDVLDLNVSDQIKVDALDLLRLHILAEAWVWRGEVTGKVIELQTTRGGWSPAQSGPIIKEGTFLRFDDAREIKDRVAKIMSDTKEGDRIRQHAKELLACIEYKDASAWMVRGRIRRLQLDPYKEQDLISNLAEQRKQDLVLEQTARKRWEEEKAKMVALEANITRDTRSQTMLTPADDEDTIGLTWVLVIIAVSGATIGAFAIWLLVRYRGRSR